MRSADADDPSALARAVGALLAELPVALGPAEEGVEVKLFDAMRKARQRALADPPEEEGHAEVD